VKVTGGYKITIHCTYYVFCLLCDFCFLDCKVAHDSILLKKHDDDGGDGDVDDDGDLKFLFCMQVKVHTMHMHRSELKSCRQEFVNWKDKTANSKKKLFCCFDVARPLLSFRVKSKLLKLFL